MKNNRTFLEKLLDGAEVEWKPLNKIVTTITAPVKLKREMYCSTGSTPIIDQGEKFIAGYTDENFEAIPSNEYIIFGDHSEHIKYVNFSFIQGADGLKILKPKEDNAKYIYYAFQNFYVKELNYKRHWSSAKETLIPLPPPTVQTEIVRILDALTAFTSELTSELTLRRKQYEYYREKLLSEEELIKLGATTENLGDITSITSGGTPSTKEPAYWVEGNIPWIKSESCKNKLIDEIKHHITEMGLQNSNAKLLSPNTTLMAMVGATIFKTAFLPFEATTNQNIAAIKSKNELSITDKFIFYYLTNMYDFFISKLSGYNMVNLSQIKNIKILLPPLEEQQRIVSILDKFEALTNSITEGLPLAIEQSQKRYEYYRELLLNFS